MGRSATGSVRLVRGKWLASLRGEHLGSHATRQLALDAITAALRIDAGTAPDSVRLYGARWLDARELGGDIRGIDSERSVWRQHIDSAAFADWPMRKVRPRDVQAWLVALSKKDAMQVTRHRDGHVVSSKGTRVSRQTVLHARRLLKACFSSAVIEGKASYNPVTDVPVPKMDVVSEEHEEWAFLSAEEIGRLFAAIERAPRATFYRAVYAVAIYGGLRKGELLGLRWEDIGDGTMTVRRSYAGPTKTKSSKREVPMLPPVRAALDAWKRHGGAVRVKGLVFPADHGSCYGESYDAAWETQWRGKAGCKSHVRFHDLRHTCASHLVIGSFGIRLELHEVQRWMGHADMGTTQRYAHLAPGALRNKVREMEALPIERK